MTLVNITNQLLSFLQKNNSFVLKEHIDLINVEENVSLYKKSLIIEAFGFLEKSDLVKKITSESADDIAWIMIKPFSSYPQSVLLSPDIIEAISETISNYNEANENKLPECDKTSVEERDIASLLAIIYSLLENLEEDGDEEDDD